MKYDTGEPVALGDKVRCDTVAEGVVVANIGEGLFSEDFTEEDWAYLGKGILVFDDEIGLTHVEGHCVKIR